jgi:hypothetical protein
MRRLHLRLQSSFSHSRKSSRFVEPTDSIPLTRVLQWWLSRVIWVQKYNSFFYHSFLILFPHLFVSIPRGFFHIGFNTKNLYPPLSSLSCAMYPTHLAFFDVTVITCGERWKLRISSLWSNHLSPLISSPLRPRNSPQHTVQALD